MSLTEGGDTKTVGTLPSAPARKKPGPKPGDLTNTKYRPELCEQIVEWGRLGKSRTWMCGKLDITRETLIDWEKLHPQLVNALARARVLSQLWWEDAAQDNLLSPTFKDGMWRANMAARFRDEWTETKQVLQTNEDGPKKAEAAAEERQRVRELTERLGRAAFAGGSGTTIQGEGEDRLPILRDLDRRAGRTGSS